MTSQTVAEPPRIKKAKNQKTPEQKAAHAAYMREYKRANRDRLLEQRRANYQASADEYRAASIAAYHKNKNSIAERRKKSYHENPEIHADRKRAWRVRNPQKAAETSRNYKQANKSDVAKTQRLYRIANREMIAAHMRNRRALARNAAGKHTAYDVSMIFSMQRGKCANCLCRLAIVGPEKYHVDHVHPLSRGGSNTRDNLQILCRHCNLSKHSKDPIEWATSQGRLI